MSATGEIKLICPTCDGAISSCAITPAGDAEIHNGHIHAVEASVIDVDGRISSSRSLEPGGRLRVHLPADPQCFRCPECGSTWIGEEPDGDTTAPVCRDCGWQDEP